MIYASIIAKQKGYKIHQYLLKGIYVSENISRRNLNPINLKMDKSILKDKAMVSFSDELNKFINTI